MKKALLFPLLLLLALASCRPTPPLEDHGKVWLHRANSIEKAQQYQWQFPGVEIDVHFIDSLQEFIVKHDADEDSRLTLGQWLEALDNRSQLGIWFDFKNLTSLNRDEALQRLSTLRSQYRLDGKLIVESSDFQALEAFREAGFLVSYYIPYFDPETADSLTLARCRNKIQGAVEQGVDAISGYDFQYDFMKREFPDHRKLLWTVDTDLESQSEFIAMAGADSLVEVLLVPRNTD